MPRHRPLLCSWYFASHHNPFDLDRLHSRPLLSRPCWPLCWQIAKRKIGKKEERGEVHVSVDEKALDKMSDNISLSPSSRFARLIFPLPYPRNLRPFSAASLPQIYGRDGGSTPGLLVHRPPVPFPHGPATEETSWGRRANDIASQWRRSV
jgi:hypothetical protein